MSYLEEVKVNIVFKKVEKNKAIYIVETDGVMFTLYHDLKNMDYYSNYVLGNDYEFVIKRTFELMQEEHEQSLEVLKYINRNKIILTKTVEEIK